MNIDVTGVDKILNRLNKYRDIESKLAETAKRLCEVGQQVAQAGFGSHANVTTRPTGSGYAVVIEGDEVLFIEFGTGDAAGIHAQEYDAVPAVVRPGSWSETHAHMYEKLGFWYFGNTKFTETPPHPYTYDAYQAMVEALPKIVNEVFK